MTNAQPPRRRVLVVEDDKGMNHSLQHKLQQFGCETDGCFDGEQALKLLEQNAYDGILLDLMMPIKDGFAVLAKKGLTRNAGTPAYVLTTLGEEKRALAIELGAKMVFLKSEETAAQVMEKIRKDMGL